MNEDYPVAHELLEEVWSGLGGDQRWIDRVSFQGKGALPSPFAATDLASAVIAAAGAAVGELLGTTGSATPEILVSRILASGWFHLPDPTKLLLPQTPHSVDWTWLSDFPTRDGRLLRIQAIFPTLRSRITKTLGIGDEVEKFAAIVRENDADAIEQRLVDAGAAVAANRTVEEWLNHPAGAAIHAEPISDVTMGESKVSRDWTPIAGRPLAGIRVLDMTRVIAGPTATRFLAALGAEVLRIDAPDSDESRGFVGQGNEFMVGKRWAFVDLKTADGKAKFLDLLAQADILVHGYRPGGIEALVSSDERFQAKPDLVEVTYCAYGWQGPWRDRRGFDTLVQWSSGIANANQSWGLELPDRRVPLTAIGRKFDASRPRHMPVEALDFGTAYQIAAAAIRGLTQRVLTGKGSVSRLSLARTASILIDKGRQPDLPEIELPLDGPWQDHIFIGAKGPLRRLQHPIEIQGNPLFWERPSEPAGASVARWTRG